MTAPTLTPDDASLPYPDWVPGQWQTISDILTSDTRFVIVEAPTGSGKSAVALACSRLSGSARMHVVTGTKQLQDQYAELGPFKIMGRNNYPCLVEPVQADEGPCTLGQGCDEKKPRLGPIEFENGRSFRREVGPPNCPYYAQKWHAMREPEVVFNYAYWLYAMNYSHWPAPDAVVFDEAHNLEDEVRRFKTVVLRQGHVARLRSHDINWPHYEPDFDGWQSWAAEHRNNIEDAHREWRREPSLWTRRDAAAIRGVYEVMTTLLHPGTDDENWIMDERPWGIEFRPVWVHNYAPQAVFDKVPEGAKIVLMTATILDPGMFCYQLGIPERDATVLRVPSNFPAERRPLYYTPVTKVKARDESSLRALTKEIDRIAQQYPDKRGLIHTGSYKIAAYIAANTRQRRRIITHDTKTRVAALERFRETPGAILLSPSVSTGVDLPYDLCEWQVIAKLPFPDQGDPQVKKRMREIAPGVPNPKGQSWYNWITACQVVQAYGRGMRAVDDACDTYLLDQNWGWFKHAVWDQLPAWFKEAIITKKSPAGYLTIEEQLEAAASEIGA